MASARDGRDLNPTGAPTDEVWELPSSTSSTSSETPVGSCFSCLPNNAVAIPLPPSPSPSPSPSPPPSPPPPPPPPLSTPSLSPPPWPPSPPTPPPQPPTWRAWIIWLPWNVAWVALHLVCAGLPFLFSEHLIEETREKPWYIALYLLLFVAALIQYFITAGSSPGYVLDAMRTYTEANSQFMSPTASKAMICSYCDIEQPPRAKHCRDCDICVLQFDHHCALLGTCIGRGNRCRFWWYIFEETALCLWTGILYITYLKTSISGAWWKDLIMIVVSISLVILFIFLLLLMLFHSYLVLTNQTTYEFVRRGRIPYLREIPANVFPFSEGICRNSHGFCCAQGNIYDKERLPTFLEVQQKSRPYTCLDVLKCRCC